MHRLPSQQSVSRFQLLALLVIGTRLLIAAAPVLLVYSLIAGDRGLTHNALWLLGFTVLVTVIQWLGASRARCPLCLGLPLAHNGCVKNRNAKRLLGSYRLRVACSILMAGRFRCPYCGELTAIAVRRRRRG